MIKFAKNKDGYSLFNTFKRFIPLTIKQLPGRTVFCVLQSFCLLTLHVMSIVILASLFTSVENFAGSGDFLIPAIWLSVTILTALISQLLNGGLNLLLADLVLRYKAFVEKRIHEKLKNVSAEAFESPQMLDTVNKAVTGADVGSMLVVLLVLTLFGYLPYFIGMAVYLYTFRPILGIAPLIVFIPVILGQLVRTKAFSDLEEKSAPIRRKYEHYEKCIASREFFKETRILGAFSFFKKLYSDSLSILNRERWRTEFRITMIETSVNLLTLAAYGFLLYLLVDTLMLGMIAAGAFAAVLGSVSNMFSMMDEMVVQNVGSALQQKGSAANVLKLLDMPESYGEKSADLSGGISLRGVRYKYPGSETDSVCGVDLDIFPGETLAIVGANGAGKSTLVKLITGLFKPTDGVVLFSNTPASELSREALFLRTSGVFQNFGRYKMTLEQNIKLSDVGLENDDVMRQVANESNVTSDMQSYPNGFDTQMSKEFGGIDISGGQWQRVAIARGLYRTHELIVLDEPTAAIDPLEETRVYKQFAELSYDKTAVIVTHRLGSCRIADRIAVMDNGRIVELGTHDELINDSSLYKTMWESQAEWLV